MKRVTSLLVAAVVASSAVVGVALWHPGAAEAAAPPTGLDFGLRDSADGSSLFASVASGDPRLGQFVISLTGIGLVWGSAPATTSPSGGSSVIQLRFDGAGYEDTKASLDPTFGTNFRAGGTPTSVSLRLVGHVDTAKRTGTVEVWIDGVHHQISRKNAPVDPSTATAKYLSGVKAADIPALYAMASTQQRSAMTLAQFTTAVSGGGAFTGITDAVSTGPAQVSANESGTWYASTPIRVTRGTAAQDGTVVLVWDSGQWRVFTVR